MTAGDQKYFFIHVMKTAGTTLRAHIRANFEPDEVYPFRRLDPELRTANTSIEYLTALSPRRRERIRVFMGHFPFVAVELLGEDTMTMTMLRDPVERTISFLNGVQRGNGRLGGKSLRRIYDDPALFAEMIKDHQAKLFSMTLADHPRSYLDAIDVDAERMAIAKRNLERVHALGLQERFDEFLATLGKRFGWRFGRVPDWFVAANKRGAPAALRRRIVADNQADIELHEHARRLYETHRGTPSTVDMGRGTPR